MISSDLQVALLIVVLYASTCVAFVYANEGIFQAVFHGFRLRIGDDRIRIGGRSPIWLNPFTPMFPAFRGNWGHPDAIVEKSDIPAHVLSARNACGVLAPYVFAVFLYGVVATPIALFSVGATRALPIVGLTYLAILALVTRLWFLRSQLALTGPKYALLVFESVVCMPFAAGIVRRLSLAVPLSDDLASLVANLPDEARTEAINTLIVRSDEMVNFYPDDSCEHQNLAQYREALASLTKISAMPSAQISAGDTCQDGDGPDDTSKS